MVPLDTFKVRRSLVVDKIQYDYFSLPALEQKGLTGISQLPFSLKILLENLLRHEEGLSVTTEDILALSTWTTEKKSDREIAYRPARVLMQDFTGVPAVVDLAAMRDAIKKMGGAPEKINPLTPVDLVIDHSVQVNEYASPHAAKANAAIEMQQNRERYEFLRWGQKVFKNFRVVPPNTGICHQINLEFLAKAVWTEEQNGKMIAFPDTLVGTDSHTTMINGLGVLGWGVGGIEAEAAMLGQPITMVLPEVIGVKLTGLLKDGILATDLVLTITERLRKKGVVGKFVEYFGPGIQSLSLADRATLANMAPEYGATCGFFPIDQTTIDYLILTGRELHQVHLVESFAKIQGLWHGPDMPPPIFTDVLEIDLSTIVPSMAGPKRPQDRVNLSDVSKALVTLNKTGDLQDGAVVIAAITSCTNTSNPSVMIAAGLLAKKAVMKGLSTKPWVKTSLAPGSEVVTQYLEATGLQEHLNQLGFNVVGHGCTTCIGNSGPLPPQIAKKIIDQNIIAAAVLSGNRNFEGRIHPLVKANWLASPPLVVAFALAGTTQIDLTKAPIGESIDGAPVYLKDIWPTHQEISETMAIITRELFSKQYTDVFTGAPDWQTIEAPDTQTYHWNALSTYIQHPPYFIDMQEKPKPLQDIKTARILAIFGDSITTDHISPAGAIKPESPAGRYLSERGALPHDFNSLGARRGNHEVMARGTFANVRIKNEMLPAIEGGSTRYFPSGEMLPIYDAAMRYQRDQVPLVIIAGKEYGTGSSRDWAAKGPKLLGVTAVIAESFERIHRSNLIGMGIVPLEFLAGENRHRLGLTGEETIDIMGLTMTIKPRMTLAAIVHRPDGSNLTLGLLLRIDTAIEADYFQQGGILPYVLRNLL